MQPWTLNFKRKSNVSHERIEALMTEFGFSWTPIEEDAAVQTESQAEELPLLWPLADQAIPYPLPALTTNN